ncbi:head maturation protease, ClpP-related [Massilia oculi]|uniref:ATP-dependent Clp protease proteolytic subunit n=1 Tax=Massilia oculi TaxID=945844 RepID=A0A2S2DFU8_9BURK|nr:head maturation protease, ClpP-related [Massilia oculi]AWL04235.1 peptidase [Massilia oculi]
MSLLQLPEIWADARMASANFDLRQDALEAWEPGVRAAAGDQPETISMYGPIGQTWDGEGVTSRRIGAALRSIGNKDVEVNLNSPGGDFFEGVAIYNLLRGHSAKVTVNVMGIAASAASVIAMAGDEVKMGDGSHLMIHNASVVAAGNRHDMLEAAAYLEPFDNAMRDMYAARTGIKPAEIEAMMDKETFIGADDAIAKGFATGKLDRAAVTKDTKAAQQMKVLATVESSLAKSGLSRSARRETLNALFNGKPGAAAGPDATPGAGNDTEVEASLQSLLNTMQG